ncbi:hypothetical protein ONZ43_g1452 [Nemania bipapillata]|uniref:Uncharacterized protein n=1 Tax=Nemania bipapillata TaxID=110536 RepID=A0ACC2J557_9PEZI|nr:hypothetical protein ONZ43_g1452 [Nemania bipapillata]
MAADTPFPKSLLAMPAEIRNTVYELVVSVEWGPTSQNYFVLDRPLPALFRVCRQVRSEALDVFLLRNHFHVYTSNIGLKWLHLLGRDVARFRFLILFIDLDIAAWQKYLEALLPLVSNQLELRIRNAAASLSSRQLEELPNAVGLYDVDRYRWTVVKENLVTREIIFRQIRP